ncbi:MAG: mechanosensitive ion channel [Planctomycetes bacterium]|nr:mechanosensitive ion channel [Planctomycetota bacterium]
MIESVRLRRALVLLALSCTFAFAQEKAASEKPAAAPTPAPAAPTSGPDAAAIELKLKAVDAAELDEATKAKVTDLYKQALSFVQAARQQADQASQFAAAIESAPAELDAVRKKLDAALSALPDPQTAAKKLSLDEVEQRLRQKQADLAAARARVNDMESQLQKLRDRPKEIQDQTAEAHRKLDQIESDLHAPTAEAIPSAVREAQTTTLQARRSMRQAELLRYQQESASFDVRLSLLTAQHDELTREVAQLEADAQAWEKTAIERRKQAAAQTRQQIEEARSHADELPPRLSAMAESNVTLSQSLEDLAARDTQLAADVQRVESQLSDIEQDLAAAKKRIEATGLTESLGMLLRKQFQSLPNLRLARASAAQRRDQLNEVITHQIDVEDDRRELSDVEAQLDAIIASWKPNLDEVARAKVQADARRVLADRRDLLDKLYTAYGRHLRQLTTLEFDERQVATRAAEYGQFIDEHLLWIRSSSPLEGHDVVEAGQGIAWLLSWRNWTELGSDFVASLRRSTLIWICGMAIVIALLALRPRCRRRLGAIAEQVSHAHTDRMQLTVRALVWTAVLALGWPLLLGFVGWQISEGVDTGRFAHAVGQALMHTARIVLFIDLFREVCRPNGLADVHFRWYDPMRRTLRGHLTWLLMALSPLIFTVSLTRAFGEPDIYQALGRMIFMLGLIAIGVFMAMVLNGRTGVMAAVRRSSPNGWMVRLRYLWYPAAVGLPLVHAALVGVGYDYTAIQLNQRFIWTFWLIVALVIAHDALVRWIQVAHRRLAWAEAKRKLEAAQREREEEMRQRAAGKADEDDDMPDLELDEPEVGMEEISEQTQRLVKTVVAIGAIVGLWLIWSQVLPALNILNNIPLWHIATMVDGAETATPITLADLFIAMLLVMATFVAARNLPGLMEIILLKHLPLDPGARYAATTVVRYVIVGVGTFAAFDAVGVSWGNLQWLIAALGVGLGFGLQEIVANFVSGLIILFERPVRVGDFVSVGGVDGWVTRIRIRATTITAQDRRELIVPNKEFITSQLINWSLSDPIIRLTINVGIAYGSDTAKAEELMLKVAHENHRVLDQPEPRALFVGFGDNTLNYELRVFINEVERRFDVIHQIHKAVDAAFREAGITIAFPQRDVHLDSTSPVKIELVRNRKGDSPRGHGERGGRQEEK